MCVFVLVCAYVRTSHVRTYAACSDDVPSVSHPGEETVFFSKQRIVVFEC